MKFKGVCNGSTQKEACATFSQDRIAEIELPVKKNGAIICGDYYDEGFLVGVDFDVRTKMTEKELPTWCQDTMIVRSGGGGYHCYFLVDEKLSNQMNNHKAGLKPRARYLKGIDVRGTNGKMFAPGTKFKSHKYPYILLDEAYATGEKDPKFMKTELLLKKVKELLVPDVHLRKGFDMVLSGNIVIGHEVQDKTKEPEFKYWKAFWREIIAQGGLPEDYFPILEQTQPEFNEKKTRYQLKKIKDIDKRPTTALYNKLFYPWDDITVAEKKKEDWITIYGDELLSSDEAFGYEEDQKKMFYWDGTVYVLNTNTVRAKVRDYLKALKKSVYGRKVSELISYMKDYHHREVWDFNTDHDRLVIENGFLNLKTNELLPATPDYLCTIKYPVTYKPTDERPPQFQKYLDNITDNKEEQDRICQIMRDVITNKLIEKKNFLVLHGVPDAGKGIMDRMLIGMVGLRNVAILDVHEFGNRFTTGELLHKVLATDTDCSADVLLSKDLGLLKKLTGLDPMRYEKKGKDGVYGINLASFIMLCNGIPQLPSGDEANSVMGRATFIKFTITHKKDPKFEIILMGELNQIFSYLIDLEPRKYKSQSSEYSNIEYWLRESDPIYQLCMDNMRWADEPELLTRVNPIVNKIYEELHSMGYGMTQDKILRGKMYQYARKIGGQKFVRQKNGSRIIYLKNIEWGDIESEFMEEVKEEETGIKQAEKDEKESSGIGKYLY